MTQMIRDDLGMTTMTLSAAIATEVTIAATIGVTDNATATATATASATRADGMTTTQKSTDLGAMAMMGKKETAIGTGDGANDNGTTNAGTGASRVEITNQIQAIGEEAAAALRNETKIKETYCEYPI